MAKDKIHPPFRTERGGSAATAALPSRRKLQPSAGAGTVSGTSSIAPIRTGCGLGHDVTAPRKVRGSIGVQLGPAELAFLARVSGTSDDARLMSARAMIDTAGLGRYRAKRGIFATPLPPLGGRMVEPPDPIVLGDAGPPRGSGKPMAVEAVHWTGEPTSADHESIDRMEALVARQFRFLRLTQEFTEIANAANSIEEGLSVAVECVCHELGWPIGHAFLEVASGAGIFGDSGVWSFAGAPVSEAFSEATAIFSFESGQGFVGGVVASGGPIWVEEGIADQLTVRSDAARREGLASALAFPILIRSRVAGVLEFFARTARQVESEQLAAAAQLGIQLGRVVERQEFHRDLARVANEERRRLGRDLHDTVSQELTGVGMLARSLERAIEGDSGAVVEQSRSLTEAIHEVRRQFRALARGLNPIDVSERTLVSVLESFAEDTQWAFGVPCRFTHTADLTSLDDFCAEQLFSIIREAVHNAAKHAQASQIFVRVSNLPGGLIEVRVRDDGRGFEVSPRAGFGMGLRSMSHRSHLIGARLRIESKPGAGTSVICTLRGGDGGGGS